MDENKILIHASHTKIKKPRYISQYDCNPATIGIKPYVVYGKIAC